jgi:hypothetical protein
MIASNLSAAPGIKQQQVQTMDIHLAIGQALFVPVFFKSLLLCDFNAAEIFLFKSKG